MPISKKKKDPKLILEFIVLGKQEASKPKVGKNNKITAEINEMRNKET